LIKAESSSDSLVFANSTYQRLSLLLPGTPQNCGANLDKCDLWYQFEGKRITFRSTVILSHSI
jgi:hypothetical protein